MSSLNVIHVKIQNQLKICLNLFSILRVHKGGRVPYGQAHTPGRKHFPPDAQGGSHLAASRQNFYSLTFYLVATQYWMLP